MKKFTLLSLTLLISLTLAGCGSKKDVVSDSSTTPEQIMKEAEVTKVDNLKVQDAQKLVWPKEASNFGVPELKSGKISGIGGTGKTIAIGYLELKKDNIEEYRKLLEKEGFSKGEDYPIDGIWNYIKKQKDGSVSVTVTFDSNTFGASIAINPTIEKIESVANDSKGTLKWLDGIPKDVPIFTKGTILEAKEVAPMMIMMYKDVTQADLDSYKTALTNAGFKFDKEDSSENNFQYEKQDSVKMTVIIVGLEYNDGNLTLYIAKS